MARTAVIAGTATSVSNRVSRRQARRWGGQEQAAAPQYAPAPPPPPPPQYAAPSDEGGDLSAEISRLGELRNQGLLSDDEFNAAKAKLLGI
jgi:hypothetical protein